jgi:hypothetical protein
MARSNRRGRIQLLNHSPNTLSNTLRISPKEIPVEAKDEIYEGYRMRFDQLFPKKTYAVIDGHYVRATPEHMETANVEKIEIGVAYAYSYTSQEFGKLAQTRPALHGLVKMIREKCATYCSNRMSDLKRRANTILNEGKERRSPLKVSRFRRGMVQSYST